VTGLVTINHRLHAQIRGSTVTGLVTINHRLHAQIHGSNSLKILHIAIDREIAV
jgi:hypothetical protein